MRLAPRNPGFTPAAPVLVALGALGALGACGGGGGGGGGPPTGLVAPGGVSLLPAEGAAVPPNPGGFASEADYFTDPVFEEVYDLSLASIGRIGDILRVPGASGSVELLNADVYAVQASAGPHVPGRDIRASSTERGRSFAASASEFEVWSVESTRAGGPHDVTVWLPRVDEEAGAHLVFFDAAIQVGVGASFPFGDMSVDFAGAVDEASLGTPFYVGTFDSYGGAGSAAGFTVYERTGDVAAVPAVGEHFQEVQAAVELDADRTNGRARIFHRERFDDGGGDSGILASEWLIELDADTVVRGRNGAAPVAFDRASPDRHAWAYGLYEATGVDAGARVDVTSGFGIRTPTGARGWFDSHGLWLPPDVTVPDGADVLHDAWGENEEVHYTVRTAPGRLMRLAQRTLDLTVLDNQVFEWFETDAGLGSTTLYQVAYDSLVSLWVKLAVFDEPSGAFVPLAPPQLVDIGAEGALPLHSTALGGPVAFVDGNTFITWYELEVVDGSDAVFAGGAIELELFGFMDCMRAELTAAEVEAGDIQLADAPDASTGQRYVFRKDDLTLYHDPSGTGAPLDRVGLAPGEVPTQGPYRWGMQTGPLIADASVPSGTVPGVWNASELYIWETGANPWNAFTGLVDALGDFVDVPMPTRFAYVHSTMNDRNGSNAHDGRTFVLELDAAVGLRGFPRVGLDLDGDSQPDRYVPAVSLADGVTLGPVGPGGREVVVKGIDVEEHLVPDPGYAGPLTLFAANDLFVPNAASYSTPSVGPAPIVTDPPRVVVGKIVGPLVEEEPGPPGP